MNWIIALAVSAAILVLSVILAVTVYNGKKRSRLVTPVNTLFAGVFLAGTALFIPAYFCEYSVAGAPMLKTVLHSLYSAFRLFIFEGDFEIIKTQAASSAGGMETAYTAFASALLLVAPILTFGVVLSFFRNFSAYRRYYSGYFKDAYIFSELNDRSLALAKDLHENDKNRLIVFTDCSGEEDEHSYELSDAAAAMGAVIFSKNVSAVNFAAHGKKAALNFFMIGESDSDNLDHSFSIIGQYRDRENTSLYVFSASTESELLLSATDKGAVKVRRISEVQSLINRTLWDEGMRIFDSAAENGERRRISAAVIGLDLFGLEMARSLVWFCQMDGYELELNAFDSDPAAASMFSAAFPELTDPRYNGAEYTVEDANYRITVHSGVNVGSAEFCEALRATAPTYVFVSLGSDEENITVAATLRSLFERWGYSPVMDAVLRDSHKKAALKDIKNRSGQPYSINFIGDLDTFYSENVILDSEVEELALRRHLAWGSEEEFWQHEYNYRSSVASAIHSKMKKLCRIPGADKPKDERSETELWDLRRLEHRRWNAYMRSEGYTYSPDRNNLAKTHNCLVPFSALSKKDQEKDDD